jgi:hypothetical protein
VKDDFRHSLAAFAREKRPSNPEIARVLRGVRRARNLQRPAYHLWALGVGGWVAAALCLGLLAKQSNEPREDLALIHGDPDRVLRSPPRALAPPPLPPLSPGAPPTTPAPAPPAPPTALASAPHRATPRPPPPVQALPVEPAAPADSTAPTDSAAPATSGAPLHTSAAPRDSAAPLAPRLTFEQSLQLARGHLFRIESLIEVIRESGTGTSSPPEQRCFAAHHHKLLGLHEASREQLRKIEAAAHQNDAPTLDLELERLVNLRQTADGLYREVRLCISAR